MDKKFTIFSFPLGKETLDFFHIGHDISIQYIFTIKTVPYLLINDILKDFQIILKFLFSFSIDDVNVK